MRENVVRCKICPRQCNIDRDSKKGFCGSGSLPSVARASLHMWEEPCISGSKGSGTVFFSGCNLRCVYCQNHSVSQGNTGKEMTIAQLSETYLLLQDAGAHNINLVNPTHFISQIRESLLTVKGLTVPTVYNTNAYESLGGLDLMKGLVDVYLPDIKYYSREVSNKYSGAGDYFETATRAILEMYKQVGEPVLDENGIIRKGLIIRHLILPSLTNESLKILDWIDANLPKGVYVSLMSQYTPYYKAAEHPEIDRRITRREYDKVLNHFYRLGFENGYVQERDSASEEYIPDFDIKDSN